MKQEQRRNSREEWLSVKMRAREIYKICWGTKATGMEGEHNVGHNGERSAYPDNGTKPGLTSPSRYWDVVATHCSGRQFACVSNRVVGPACARLTTQPGANWNARTSKPSRRPPCTLIERFLVGGVVSGPRGLLADGLGEPPQACEQD
jgi:hypothetical protein